MSKKTTKRLTKKEVRNKLLVLFEHSQGQQLEVKTIFGMPSPTLPKCSCSMCSKNSC